MRIPSLNSNKKYLRFTLTVTVLTTTVPKKIFKEFTPELKLHIVIVSSNRKLLTLRNQLPHSPSKQQFVNCKQTARR